MSCSSAVTTTSSRSPSSVTWRRTWMLPWLSVTTSTPGWPPRRPRARCSNGTIRLPAYMSGTCRRPSPQAGSTPAASRQSGGQGGRRAAAAPGPPPPGGHRARPTCTRTTMRAMRPTCTSSLRPGPTRRSGKSLFRQIGAVHLADEDDAASCRRCPASRACTTSPVRCLDVDRVARLGGLSRRRRPCRAGRCRPQGRTTR